MNICDVLTTNVPVSLPNVQRGAGLPESPGTEGLKKSLAHTLELCRLNRTKQNSNFDKLEYAKHHSFMQKRR